MRIEKIKPSNPLKLSMLFVLMVSLLNLSACASLRSYSHCDIHSMTGVPFLHPSEYGVNLISTQQISITTKKRKFVFIALLEINSEQLSLVSLTPLGQKLFQIQYRVNDLIFTGYGVPEYFEPAFLLSDISLMYGKENSLRQCYGQANIPFSLTQATYMTRSISIGNQPKQDLITIDYSSKASWDSHILYRNTRRGYTIEVKSLGIEHL